MGSICALTLIICLNKEYGDNYVSFSQCFEASVDFRLGVCISATLDL